MRFTKSFVVIAATAIGMAGLLGAGAAGAQAVATSSATASSAPYPPVTPPSISLSATAAADCDTVTVAGTNFGADEHVAVSWQSTPSDLGTATTDPAGSFSLTFTVPSGVSGSYAITGTGQTSGRSASATVSIDGSHCLSTDPASAIAKTVAPTSGLPNTGFAVLSVSALGVLALLVGGLLVLAGRRRNRA
jgi:LPXTG-motif cell wall-anchored protein